MSAPPDEPNARIAALQAELEAVKRREAQYRADMVHEFLDRGERNTYLHTLREHRAALIKREQEAFADLEELTRKLEAEGLVAAALAAELERIKSSWAWRLGAPLRALEGAMSPSPRGAARGQESAPVGAAVFTYYLHTSPFRIYREPSFTLRGWAWPQDGRAVTAVRVNLSGRVFEGRTGIEEPEVIARYGPQPANPRPGFEVTFETPAGRQSLSLEAQVAGSEWLWIMRTSIWCEPARP
ncbi:MAG TPA: hypothetical protein VN877_06380 [Opitutaceae bacterium]|nr:hypothetical protein [Opitutaceae bacterium]